MSSGKPTKLPNPFRGRKVYALETLLEITHGLYSSRVAVGADFFRAGDCAYGLLTLVKARHFVDSFGAIHIAECLIQ